MQEMNVTPQETKGLNPSLVVGGLVVVGALVAGVFWTQNSQRSGQAPANDSGSMDQTEQTMLENSDASNELDAPMVGGDAVTSDPATSGMAETGTVQTITMEAGAFYYKPDVIRAKKGDTIRIVMTSKDMMHDFNIAEFNVKSDIAKSGETTTFEFVADKVGQFEYFCSVGQHRANGQVGTLVVE